MANSREIPALTEGQAAIRRLMVLGATVVVLLLVGVATLLTAGGRALDELQAREDRTLVQNVVDRCLIWAVNDITTSTVWDQAYKQLRPGGDLDWADAEIGSYFAHNRGHDWTVAIDAHDRPFYAWAGQGRVDASKQGALLADAMPLIRKARAVERARGGRPPHAEPTNPILAETAAGIIRSGGVYYIVAASTVTPEHFQADREPGPAALVVSAQRVDTHLLPGLRQLRMSGLRIEAGPPASATAVALKDAEGRTIGSLAWTPEHPGLEVLSDAAPLLALGFLVVGGLTAALGWQIARVTRRLHAHEQAHDEARRELEEARDRAETANIAKSQFLANMSHEIRTPLNGVLGMAQVLARSNLAPADHDKVQVIRSSGETLLGLLNDLLDLSKIEAGRMELDVHDFDLAEVVDVATRSFATIAGQKDVGFLIEIAPEAAGVWRGDGGRIRQVLANLASNAVKFTTSGEIRVSVRRTPVGIACTVADSGAGIARERLAQLFQRFSQVDPTATRKFGGTGLGLAISRELVEMMGGTVAVTSVEGRGSAFSFELPLTWVGASAQARQPEAECALPSIRVLAAEDNRTNQLLLTAILEPLGVDLRLTADGRETVAAFAAERFDLVLMDIQMPVMNGVDAVREIRRMEAELGLAATPILALSANVMRHQIEEYLAAGMNGFVAKPIEMADLIGAMEDVLAPAEAAEAAAA